ncbi:MAG TPA: NBR1-Ig-like domain-containing protein [Anaerolineales bacterium]|jgi:hypothetical protein
MMHKFPPVMIVLLLISALVSACGSSEADATPTISVEQIQTQAVQTFASGLTATALANPTATSTPMPTATRFATLALGTPFGSTAPPAGAAITSCNKLVYVRDVSIPDNTPMTPGQIFTKTWEVQNNGSCPWAPGFKFALVGGDAMGGQTVVISQAVATGSATQLSVPMTAPTDKTGVISATWRMSDAAGLYFGDALTVVIVIGGATGTTPAAATATFTLTPTSTP